jgi:hypothetical protein
MSEPVVAYLAMLHSVVRAGHCSGDCGSSGNDPRAEAAYV